MSSHLDGKGEPASTVHAQRRARRARAAPPRSSRAIAGLGIRGLQRNAVTEVRVADKARARPRQAPARRRRCAASRRPALVELAGDAALRRLPVLDRRRALPQPDLSRRFTGEHSAADISGAFLMRGQPALRHDAAGRASRAALRRAASCSRRCSTTRRAACSRARSSSRPARRRPTASRWRRRCCCRRRPSSTPSPSLRSSPTTWFAATARPRARSTRICCSISRRAASPRLQARALLIQAFVGEALERVEDEALRDALPTASADWLGVKLE